MLRTPGTFSNYTATHAIDMSSLYVQAWIDFKRSKRKSVEKVSSSQDAREVMVGGQGSPIPIIYGRTKVGATVVFAGVKDDTLHLVCVWGEGPIQQVEALYLDDDNITTFTHASATHYTGTAGQTCPAALSAAFPSYTDNLPYIAYSYVTIGKGADLDSVPNITAVIKGIKVYDPRTATTVYGNNPALCLANFITNERYGRGRGSSGIDWDSVEAAADVCDEVVNSKARRTIGLAIQQSQDSSAWQEALRTYAGVFIYEDGGKVYFVPDRTRATDHTFNGDNILKGSVVLSINRSGDSPDSYELKWTDASTNGKFRDATTKTSSGDALRTSSYSLPGITDASEAKRFTVEMLNKSLLCGRSIQFTTFGYGLKVTPGDVIEVTHNGWLDAAKFRVAEAKHTGYGRWQISGDAYDANVYSDAVQSDPDWNDPDLDNPASPTVPTGLALTENYYQLQNGMYASRIQANWDDMSATYAFLDHYQVKFTATGIDSGWITVPSNSWISDAVRELSDGFSGVYTVYVRSVSSIGALSASASTTITIEGKDFVPSDVAGFTDAAEGNNWVRLLWNPVSDRDIAYYEVRRGTTAQDWDTATFQVARVDACVFLDTRVSVGTWRYFVKAVDYAGQESTNAAYVDVVVSQGTYYYIDENDWDESEWTFTKMSAYTVRGQGAFIVPDNGELIAYGHTTADNAVGTFEDLADVPMCLPRSTFGGSDGTNDTITAVADSWDLTVEVGGQWVASQMIATTYSTGATTDYAIGVGVSADDITWDEYEVQNVRASGRYGRIKIQDKCSSGSGTFTVQLVGGSAHMEISGEEREEKGIVYVPATAASQPVSVSLTGGYSAVQTLQLTPEGAGGATRMAMYDNLDTTGFDVYLFDAAGNMAYGNVSYLFVGA